MVVEQSFGQVNWTPKQFSPHCPDLPLAGTIFREKATEVRDSKSFHGLRRHSPFSFLCFPPSLKFKHSLHTAPSPENWWQKLPGKLHHTPLPHSGSGLWMDTVKTGCFPVSISKHAVKGVGLLLLLLFFVLFWETEHLESLVQNSFTVPSYREQLDAKGRLRSEDSPAPSPWSHRPAWCLQLPQPSHSLSAEGNNKRESLETVSFLYKRC